MQQEWPLTKKSSRPETETRTFSYSGTGTLDRKGTQLADQLLRHEDKIWRNELNGGGWRAAQCSLVRLGRGAATRPPISMLSFALRQVPFLQTFVLPGTISGGSQANVEIGGWGNVLLPKERNACRNFCFFVSPNIIILQ